MEVTKVKANRVKQKTRFRELYSADVRSCKYLLFYQLIFFRVVNIHMIIAPTKPLTDSFIHRHEHTKYAVFTIYHMSKLIHIYNATGISMTPEDN